MQRVFVVMNPARVIFGAYTCAYETLVRIAYLTRDNYQPEILVESFEGGACCGVHCHAEKGLTEEDLLY